MYSKGKWAGNLYNWLCKTEKEHTPQEGKYRRIKIHWLAEYFPFFSFISPFGWRKCSSWNNSSIDCFSIFSPCCNFGKSTLKKRRSYGVTNVDHFYIFIKAKQKQKTYGKAEKLQKRKNLFVVIRHLAVCYMLCAISVVVT